MDKVNYKNSLIKISLIFIYVIKMPIINIIYVQTHKVLNFVKLILVTCY